MQNGFQKLLILGVFSCLLPLYGVLNMPESSVSEVQNLNQKNSNLMLIIDFDTVISKGRSPDRISDYTPLMSFRGLWKMITLLPTLFGKFDEIKTMGMNIAKNTVGNGNIVHELIKKLKNKGYGDVTSLEEDIIKLTVLDEPIKDNIEVLKQLKASGVQLVGATDQDALHYKFYKERMANKGVVIDQLFDVVITYKFLNNIDLSDRHLVVDVSKSEDSYLIIMRKALNSKFSLNDTKIVYVDNKSLKHTKKIKNVEVVEFENMQNLVNKIGEYGGGSFEVNKFLQKTEPLSKKKGRSKRAHL